MSDTYEPNKGVAYHSVLCTSVIEYQSLNLTGLIVHRDPDFVLCHMPFTICKASLFTSFICFQECEGQGNRRTGSKVI